MSSQSNLFVDTGLLRDHVSKLREEKKLASRLYENIAAMRTVADPADTYQYDLLLHDIGQMIEYFDQMAIQLAHINDEAVLLSHELRGIIKDSTELSRRITENSIVL